MDKFKSVFKMLMDVNKPLLSRMTCHHAKADEQGKKYAYNVQFVNGGRVLHLRTPEMLARSHVLERFIHAQFGLETPRYTNEAGFIQPWPLTGAERRRCWRLFSPDPRGWSKVDTRDTGNVPASFQDLWESSARALTAVRQTCWLSIVSTIDFALFMKVTA